jgi:catechol 2,3-dioxygenase-like lactoylglutathione lyase family enzyme
MKTPELESLLLASRDPGRLLTWYCNAFGVKPDVDGFLHFGRVSVLIVPSDAVAASTAEPGRVLLNWEVGDIEGIARHLAEMGAPEVAPIEYRKDGGAWFHTVSDPDGNYVQVIQLTPEYWAQRRAREAGGLAPRTTLQDASCASRLPAQDLDRARRFYADKLGLEPAETRQGGLSYECGGTSFAIFESTGRPSGDHTQLSFYVADIDSTVAELRARGLEFDDAGIVDIQGHYPSTGATGERATWFHDSEGNLLAIGQLTYASTPDH